eukprot:472580-Pleurochrysis_carterae.AAC.1
MYIASARCVTPPPPSLDAKPIMRSCAARRRVSRGVPPSAASHAAGTASLGRTSAAPAVARRAGALATCSHLRPVADIAIARGTTTGSSSPTVNSTASWSARPLIGAISAAKLPCARSIGTAAPRLPS